MSMALAKDSFVKILADPDNKVIALSGKWGTGKTHLWGDVQSTSTDDAIKHAVKASLFGLSSITDLKLKIAQAMVPQMEKGGARADAIKTAMSGGKKILKALHPSFSALDELTLLAVPAVLKGRFIVIDDIERKHDKLSIDEILGFIDDCIQNYKSRVLIILNTDQLGDKKLWDLFREKVIDQELRLDTTPTEAFDIALNLTPSAYHAMIRPAVEACQVTNIRIIRKIIRVVNRLLEDQVGLDDEVLSRVVPSTVLLSAINYKGLEDGPEFDFVLKFESTYFAMKHSGAEEDVQEDNASKARARWVLLLEKLGIRGTDEFEALVVDYLRSGLVAEGEVRKIVQRYVAEKNALVARRRAQEFFQHSIWHPELDDAALLEEFQSLTDQAPLLDMFMLTGLFDEGSKLPGGAPIARRMLDAWLVRFRGLEHGPDAFEDFNFWARQLHPEIDAEVKALRGAQQANVNILAVCRKVRQEKGWGTKDEAFMKTVTTAEYRATIEAHTGEELKLLLLQSVHFCENRKTYDPHFGAATQSFLDACRNICVDNACPRLVRIIEGLFAEAKLSSHLAPAAATGEAPAAGGAEH